MTIPTRATTPRRPRGSLRPAVGSAAVRLYGQGLGDCFLLAFPRLEGGDPVYVVIDCGIAKGTPDERERMRRIVEDLREATGGVVDVLVVTHQHYDHISGFLHAEDLWRSMTVDAVWLAWTEIETDEEAGELRQVKNALNLAAASALEHSLGMEDDALPGLRMQSGFLGINPDEVGAGGASPFAAASGMDRAMAIARSLGPNVYCEPGEVREIPGTGVRAYVFGPPRTRDSAGQPLTNKRGTPLVRLLEDEHEMYGYGDLGITPSGAGSRQMSLGASPARDALAQAFSLDRDEEYDRYCPFDSTLRVPWDDAMLREFFWDHYTSGPEWRRIDEDWLGGGPDLALRAGGFTNNISLVLAFELPVSQKVLLFPGDAQVGNWLSWHRILKWKPVEGAQPPQEGVNVKRLLGRVVFYKVGHHGSHNATLKDQGLELMAKLPDGRDTDLVAYIPVSVPVAHEVMKYCPMPFYPLLRRLQEKTGGHVFLANGKRLDEAAELPSVPGLKISSEMLPPKVYRGTEIEGAVPLYVQITLGDEDTEQPDQESLLASKSALYAALLSRGAQRTAEEERTFLALQLELREAMTDQTTSVERMAERILDSFLSSVDLPTALGKQMARQAAESLVPRERRETKKEDEAR